MKVRDIDVFTDILVPTENAELRNPSSLVNDTIIEAIENEINLPLECLDPATKDYQKTVNSALQRIQETSK